MLKLESGSLLLNFSEENGALTLLESKKTGWTIERRPELGLSWRLLVPVNDELRNNPVYGEKQTPDSIELMEDRIRFVWKGVESERAGRLDIDVELEVRVEGEQAVWYMTVHNHSPYIVESVYSPYLGDLTHPEGDEWFKTFLYSYSSAQEWNIWPRFSQHEGTYGVDFPTQVGKGNSCSGAPMSPFILLRSENQGLYVGIKRYSYDFVGWHLELRPGHDSAIDGRVPLEEEIAGKVVHTRFAAIQQPYLQPGESAELMPIALEAFEGGWQKGVDIYRAWRDEWDICAEPQPWAKDVHSWLQLHINSPEDELRMRFTELPKVAKECAEYGVKAIQLVGWNWGGQDQGNPSHMPDPRLGTFEELKQAIAECQALGVKVILFTKFTWTDRGTDWFRKELIDCSIKDPYGDYYMHCGYQYQTPAQLFDINTKRLIPMCFGDERYMKVCRNEFQRVIDLNSDGMLFDECFHHGPALMCFDQSHGHRYGWPVYSRDEEFVTMLENMPGLRNDFLITGEALYDWQFRKYTLSYVRSWGKNYIPLSRYLRPKSLMMTAITGFNDRNMLNQCLMYRYIMSYEPYCFKGWLHDYPDTMAYGQKVDALRKEHRKYFWDGEYRDACDGMVVNEAGKKHHPYAVYKAEDGKLGMIISNYEDEPVRVRASLEVGCPVRYRTVDEDVWFDASDWIDIPARSAVAVLPE